VEIIYQNSLAASARWIKFSTPNENWAQAAGVGDKIVCNRRARRQFFGM